MYLLKEATERPVVTWKMATETQEAYKIHKLTWMMMRSLVRMK